MVPVIVLVMGAGLVPSQAGAAGVCAPLQGTPAYSQCINDQLTGRRSETHGDRKLPGPVPPPTYLPPDGTLEMPIPGETLEQRGARELNQAQSNSDFRTKLLQQRMQRNLRNGIRIPPPSAGGTMPSWQRSWR